MWRYACVLPNVTPVTLGEGWTPLIRSRRHPALLIKEEGANPTGDFEARGLGMAATMAKHYGFRHIALPSAGNAAGALAAYAAAAGLIAHLFIPNGVSFPNYLKGMIYGAEVTLVDGGISDCARILQETIQAQKVAGTPENEVWFDISTHIDPFRVEGEKTMGYELVEQLGWTYPDAVFCPTEGGAGLVGIWKAFEEMETLGWVSGRRPKIYALEDRDCAPARKAFDEHKSSGDRCQNMSTSAAVSLEAQPDSYSTVYDIIEESGGKPIAATDKKILASVLDWARSEGLFLSLEGAAATAAYDKVLRSGELHPSDKVVLINPQAGYKSADRIAEAMHLRTPGTLPTSLPVGGIITPV